ncbi:hypothetical protein RND81_02G065400 [Saponaria officinalis]|uniref:Uncharacterized protein n=1 Tax=Saponaria officinalis TaxID=3572 RepID=A0AAW1MRW9_SAPOF
MKSSFFLFIVILCVFFLSHFGESSENEQTNEGGIYIVYMGDASQTNKINHNTLVTSLLKRNKNAIIQSYKNGFTGFAARLTEAEAEQLHRHPGVVSVFPEPILQLHTTRSWDFLKDETSLLITSQPSLIPTSVSQSSDTVIGILDTGIWPESESFSDEGMGPIPSRWKGTCVEGIDFNSSNCNKKLIGARYYKDEDSGSIVRTARDSEGHGTHVSSTAAGASVLNASYYGLAPGTAKGGSSSARIAMYRVCSSIGCPGSAILAAFDDAIADGVDILSLSLGASGGFAPDLSQDPIAIGAFHAVQRGITVVCSAGNDGPSQQSVVNVAPWIITVAATTIDRDLESSVVLGNKNVIPGGSINFSNLDKSPIYPLIYGGSAKNTSGSDTDARNCYPNALSAQKINGSIVLCQHDSSSQYSMREKREGVKALGAVGAIFINDKTRLVASNTGLFPATVITSKDGDDILGYINSTGNPLATVLPTQTVTNFKPAPTVAFFSARGPSYTTKNLLKPDIAAPGVNILAAWIANDTSEDTTPSGKDPPRFNLLSGTSMACPHASGIVANVKSQYPTWSPAAIRSAIMTTAIQMNNLKETIATETAQAGTAYDYGAGEVSPTGGLQPGLVYELDPSDYLLFLCYYGYNLSTIKLISSQFPDGFSCPSNSTKDMISNLNYPSIALSKMNVTVNRTVTNVDTDAETTYSVIVNAPKGLDVNVTPNELVFTKDVKKLSYQVTFSSSSSLKGDLFGAITWTNKKYNVRSPFVVSID